MVQGLRALNALPEEPDTIPSTHMAAGNHQQLSITPVLEDPKHLYT